MLLPLFVSAESSFINNRNLSLHKSLEEFFLKNFFLKIEAYSQKKKKKKDQRVYPVTEYLCVKFKLHYSIFLLFFSY